METLRYGLSIGQIRDIVCGDDLLKHHCQSILIAPNFSNIVNREGHFSLIFWPNYQAKLGHWTVIFLNGGIYEYFDSLGENFENNHSILKELNVTKPIISSNIAFQCTNSNLCGHFAIFFCQYRILELLESYPIFLAKTFSLVCQNNERIVKEYWARHYGNQTE